MPELDATADGEADHGGSAGRHAAIVSVTLCLISLPIGLFAAPVLTVVSAPTSYLAAEGLTRIAWFRRNAWVATLVGVLTGALVSLAALIYLLGALL